MNNVTNTKSTNYKKPGGGKMSLRKIFIEYSSEFVFGFVLLGCVLLSYWLAQFIPTDFFNRTLSPIMNGCTAAVSIAGAIILLRHHKGVHVRVLWACVLLTWAVLLALLLMHAIRFNEPILTGQNISLSGQKLLIGNVFAWILMFYPIAVLRPGWLNAWKALIPFIPVVIVATIDYCLPVDLSWIYAIIPVLWMGLLAMHIRAYRKWCEENYSSMDDIDVQWIWRYIIMYLFAGGCYTVMSISYSTAHAFTQQWFLLFMLTYSTDQILFRQDPWVLLRRAKSQQALDEEEEEGPTISFAEYRPILEAWMEAEKPYCNPEFRLMDLRQVLPLNRTYLSLLINTEYGCNFYHFVTGYRIEEAKRQMKAHPEMMMQDIAELCGFSSPTVFARVFSREVGMTPTEWSSQNSTLPEE